MAVSSTRKWSAAFLFVALLAGVTFAFLPYVLASKRMQKFCRELTVGVSMADIEARAQAEGYEVSSRAEGRAILHDPESFGRLICDVRHDASGLLSAAFSDGD
jgi:hypothetical protein